jgi:hypothetical protein
MTLFLTPATPAMAIDLAGLGALQGRTPEAAPPSTRIAILASEHACCYDHKSPAILAALRPMLGDWRARARCVGAGRPWPGRLVMPLGSVSVIAAV